MGAGLPLAHHSLSETPGPTILTSDPRFLTAAAPIHML
jgi:hypothetical protein